MRCAAIRLAVELHQLGATFQEFGLREEHRADSRRCPQQIEKTTTFCYGCTRLNLFAQEADQRGQAHFVGVRNNLLREAFRRHITKSPQQRMVS